MSRNLGRAARRAVLFAGFLCLAVNGALADDDDPALNDRLAIMSRAPGTPENSPFLNFENQESVSAFNGNLIVRHPSSPTIPGRGSLTVSLVRTYNSKLSSSVNAEIEVVGGMGFSGPQSDLYATGFSWAGMGWRLHLGRIAHYATKGGPAHWDGPAARLEMPDGTAYDAPTAEMDFQMVFYRLPGGTCDPGGTNCLVSTTGVPYWLVTLPSGTRYYFEHNVPDELSWSNYIRNADTAGWYVTRIVDVHGNEIRVKYWSDNAAACPTAADCPYAEAIESIAFGDALDHPVIRTTLYDTGRVKGMLKTIVAQDGAADPAVYTFIYDPVAVRYGNDLVGAPNPTRDGGVLREVQLPGGAGSVKYGYGLEPDPDTHATTCDPSCGRLTRIDYPTGGVSTYFYSGYTAGIRDECPKAALCEHAGDPMTCLNNCRNNQVLMSRTSQGVKTRTIFPQGDQGTGKPSATWTWTRVFGYDLWHQIPNSQTSGVYRYFAVTNPDGTKQVTTFHGDPYVVEGTQEAAMAGTVEREEWYDSAGTLLRAKDYSYQLYGNALFKDATQRGSTTSYYDDPDGGSCFSGGPAGTGNPRSQSVRRDGFDEGFKQFKQSTASGSYMELTPDGSAVAHAALRNFESPDAPLASGSGAALNIHGEYDVGSLQESGSLVCRLYGACRREWKLSWNGLGQVNAQEMPADWRPAQSNLAQYGGQAEGGASSQVTSFTPEGHPARIAWATVAPAWLGAAPSYAATYGWTNGQASSLQYDGVDYKSVDNQVGADGLVHSAADPNGLLTAYTYDALRRVTAIAPEGEHPTLATYPNPNTIEVSRSLTDATTESNDESQSWSKLVFDGLGRVSEHWKKLPGGARAVQVTRYDQMGRTVFASEWMGEADWTAATATTWADAAGKYFVSVPYRNGRPWGTTTFYGTPSTSAPDNPLLATPDALGRARRVVGFDGSSKDLDYCGPHKREIVHGVNKDATTGAAGIDSETRYYYDGLGRLAVVDAPTGAADAFYYYDPHGALTVAQLVPNASAFGTDPFDAWRRHLVTGAQTRVFRHDALGRLVSSDVPEEGKGEAGEIDEEVLAYDAWGDPLVTRDALGRARGYFFRHVYDAQGRPLRTERVLGTPQSPASSDVERLGTDGTLSGGLGSWVSGSIVTDAFVAGNSHWRGGALPSCIPAPAGSTGTGLSFGDGCSYAAASSGREAVRLAVSGATKDDLLSFKEWRDVRSASGADALEVWATLQSSGDDVGARRLLYRADGGTASLRTWLSPPPVRPGDFFSASEWPEGATRDVYLYVVFKKGNSSAPATGAGAALTDLRLGRKAVEVVAETEYDETSCPTGAPAASCSALKPLGKPTTVRAYEAGRPSWSRSTAYGGPGGRPSATVERGDWTGALGADETAWPSWVSTAEYDGLGQATRTTAPYRPGIDAPHVYETTLARGLLLNVSDPAGRALLAGGVVYDAAGAPTLMHFANGAATAIGRDAGERVASMTATDADGTALWSSGAYAYDGAGLVRRIGGQVYAYDAALRLVGASVLPQATNASKGTPDDLSFAYDAFGNATASTLSVAGVARTDSPLTFAASFASSGDPSTNRNRPLDARRTYDLAGNATRFPGQAGEQDGALWDEQGRMTRFVAGDPLAGGAPAESYRYDAGRWRWLRTGRDGLPRITLRDASGQPAADYEVDAATARPKLVREYVYAGGALAVERRYASDGTASEWYHHRDHLGSLRIVTDENGRKAEAHDWYPYGQEMASWTATGATTRKLYTGHERDAETGLDYMLARYYASPSGAFLTVDPLDASAKAADPLSWNRYAYVRGNPLNRVDPTGEADGDSSAEPEKKKELSDNGQGGAASLQDDLKQDQQKLERRRAEQRAQLPAVVAAPAVQPTTGIVSQQYSSTHPGVDIAAPVGTKVVAVAPGVVVNTSPMGRGAAATGPQVTIYHGLLSDGRAVYTKSLHLSAVSVRVGDFVDAGSEIGRVGNLGNSTGPHLHFQITVAPSGVDPFSLGQVKSLSPRTFDWRQLTSVPAAGGGSR